MDRSTMGGFSPARVTGAKKGTSSASLDERERPGHRSDSLFTRSNNAEVDIRSLNLHSRARVVEILGCSEAMWNWGKSSRIVS